MPADCMCYLNLSTDLENLTSGNTYHIEIWNEDNTLKYGEIDVPFDAGDGESNIILGDDYQSDCFDITKENDPLSKINKAGELGTITYEINDDVLTVFHNEVYLNCGAEIHFEISVDGLNITLNEVNTGQDVYCMCYFNLSVDIENLTPGNTYHIEVWDEDNITKYGEIDVDY